MSDVQFEEQGNTIGNRVMYSNAPATPKLVQLMMDWKLAGDTEKANKILIGVAIGAFVFTFILIKFVIFGSVSSKSFEDLSPQEKSEIPRQIQEILEKQKK